MDNQEKARLIVAQYFNNNAEQTDNAPIELEDTYVVWFCYILGGWKALISTTVVDGMYYEVTYDKVNQCTYLDAYKKWQNIKIPDNGLVKGIIPVGRGIKTGSLRSSFITEHNNGGELGTNDN